MGYFRMRRVVELAALDRPWVGEVFMRKRFAPPMETSAQEWDSHYSGTAYDRLFRSDQRHHHRLLAALINEYRPHPKVLEIGCGEGAFYESLRHLAPAGYHGVDFSDTGVAAGRRRFPSEMVGRPTFEVGDGRTYEPGEKYDAIVFPECIEYLGDPIDLLRRYSHSLHPDGVFGVSMWLNTKPLRIWRKIQATCDVLDESVVAAPWGGAWLVAVFRPPRPRKL
jgi:trans-aconitate methyltransferase